MEPRVDTLRSRECHQLACFPTGGATGQHVPYQDIPSGDARYMSGDIPATARHHASGVVACASRRSSGSWISETKPYMADYRSIFPSGGVCLHPWVIGAGAIKP